MNRYQAYKDSGEQWLGDIPSHWEMRKMKFTFMERSEKGHSNEPLLAATQGHGVILKANYESRTVEATKGLDTLKLVEIGDFVISLRSFQGGLEYAYNRGIISPAYTVLTPTYINKDYFKYLAKSQIFILLLKSTVTGIREGQNIDYSKLKEYSLPIPPTEEQRKIGIHLDRVTAQIDKAIAQQQRMIDLLNERKQIIIQHAVTKGLDPNAEMVDSGVEWIGEMPKGWSVYKLKHICNAFGRIGFRGYSTSDLVEENEGAITLSPSNMKDGGMTYEKCTYLSWKKYEESSEIKIHDGDIIFVKTGSSYGKSSIVYGLPKEATVNPQLLVFKDIRCSREFLSYVLMTNSIRNQIETSVIGGTIPTISQNKILNFSFTCPSKGEQENIVCKLGELINPIKSSIKKIEKRISFLRERKQIIINEVITGKVKVS